MRRAVVGVLVAALSGAALPSVADAAGPAAARPAAAEPTVCIIPLGDHDRRALPVVVRGIEYVYDLEVRVLPGRPLPDTAWYQPRRRHRAEKILAYLDAKVVPGSGCAVVMGFTGSDISTTKAHHADWGMLGYAWIGGRSGVMSTYRLGRRVSRRAALVRAVKVMNHELGHALGLEHHDRTGCLMSDLAGTVKTVDREPGLLCDDSRREIEKLRAIALPVRTAIDWRAILAPRR
jgi:archaemetzincin